MVDCGGRFKVNLNMWAFLSASFKCYDIRKRCTIVIPSFDHVPELLCEEKETIDTVEASKSWIPSGLIHEEEGDRHSRENVYEERQPRLQRSRVVSCWEMTGIDNKC